MTLAKAVVTGIVYKTPKTGFTSNNVAVSSFVLNIGTNDELLVRVISKRQSLEEVVITGCCTDICVMNLAIPLVNYFDEQNKDVTVRVPQNTVETFNSEVHDRREYNSIALRLMKNQGIGVENI